MSSWIHSLGRRYARDGTAEQIILDQAVIEDTDLFVGILWNRFGTETGKANSGTEEEFDIAYRAWKGGGRPHILLFFCSKPASLNSEEELQQRSKVLQFRSKVESMGLVRSFEMSNEFENVLRHDLSNYLLSHFGRAVRSPAAAEPVSPRTPTFGAVTADMPPAFTGPSTDVTVGDKKMIYIPGGEFLRGESSGLSTTDPFWIDEAPVTNKQFWLFVYSCGYLQKSNPYLDAKASSAFERLRRCAQERPDHPVTLVTWFDAIAYATSIVSDSPPATNGSELRGGEKAICSPGEHF